MGKSDVMNGPTTIEMAETGSPKLFSVGLSEMYITEDKKKTNSPPGIELLTYQVAGHMHNDKSIGMFKHNDMVLKPITKPLYGQMEIDFYEELEKSQDDVVLELKQFVPKYLGYKLITVNDKDIKCIALEDLTKDFKEPCIMDIKIGKRTWDPLATYEKITSEENKYSGTKRTLGLSIPGFLVHKISNGRLCQFGKDYGKNLTSESIKDALKTFMNGDIRLSRDLLLQFLVDLWRILRWFRKQKRFRFFSSSLLFIYDAKRLKQYITNNNASPNTNLSSGCRRIHLYKPLSLMKLNDDCPRTGFSGQFTKDGLILHSTPSTKLSRISSVSNDHCKHSMQKQLNKLRRVHSFQNNYDNDLQKMRKDYTFILDDLVDEDQGNEMWATVKMIDFAHVFPSEHNEIDRNYLEGLESLVKIFEEFLSETIEE